MSTPAQSDSGLESRLSSRLIDVLIRASLIGVMVVLCYQIFSPFLTLMVWALILAITIYPLHQLIARKVGRKQWLASTIVVIAGVVLIVTPTALLMNSFGESVRGLVHGVQNNTLEIPVPRTGVQDWPLVGEKLYVIWSAAHSDLPGLVQSLQPKIGDLARDALAMVASIGVGILKFLAALIISGILMAYGESGARASRAIFSRIVGVAKGQRFTDLAAATIRAVANGVIGVAFIQSTIIGIALLVAGVPWAGVLAAVGLILGIAQIPALIVILPAIIYIWSSGNYSSGTATIHTIVLVLSGLVDNVLKPLMLGRGVDAPMPVILLGALGGMATAGILGMFVGATLLTIGYKIFMNWVANNPEANPAAANNGTSDS